MKELLKVNGWAVAAYAQIVLQIWFWAMVLEFGFPERWMSQWYGFALMVTIITSIIGASALCINKHIQNNYAR